MHSDAALLVTLCAQKKLRIAVAESCTGGMVAAAITDVPGASAVFDYGFIAYANAAKMDLLGVPAALIEKHGAVSAEVAEAMASGAMARAKASLAVAITGIAGPGGGTAEKPVGTVFIACGGKVEKCLFPGNRAEIRASAAQKALSMLYETAARL